MKRSKLLALLGGICLVLVLAALPFMAACAKPAPAPAPAPEKVWELKFGSDDPPTFPWTLARNEWIKRVTEATKGRVKVTQYDSMTLFKGADAYRAVISGIGDIENSTVGYYPGQFPLTEVIVLPLLGIPKGVIAGTIIWRLSQEFSQIQSEYAEVKLIGFNTAEPYCLLTTKKPVRNLDDIKGLKIRALGGPPTEMTKAFGAVPLTVPMPEAYLALQKGTVDGIWDPALALVGFKHYEVAKYFTELPTTNTVHPLVMNLNTWNSLTPDVQKQIMSVSGEKYAQLLGKVCDDHKTGMADVVAKAGYAWEVIKVSPEDMAKFINIGGKPVWNDWVTKWKDKGPTQKILDRALELAKELSK